MGTMKKLTISDLKEKEQYHKKKAKYYAKKLKAEEKKNNRIGFKWYD